MTDWVHCNTCFSLLGSGKRFLLTSCGHIYCNDCATGSEMNCQICGNSCTTIHLTTQMKPDVEIYFMDPQDLLKKYMKQLQQIINFQNSHRMRLSAYFKKEILKIKKLKEECKINFSNLKELEKQNISLTAENSYLKQLLSSKHKSNNMMDAHSSNNSFTDNMKSDSNTQKNYSKSFSSLQFQKSSNMLEMFNGQRTSMPARVTVRTPPVNGHIGIVPIGTPQSCTSVINQSISPSFSNLSVPKIFKETNIYLSPTSSPSSQYSNRTPINQNTIRHSGLTQDFSGKMSLSPSSSKHLTMVHKPIQLKPEFRHPGLIRKAKVSPYSPDEE
ncbi:probable E3 SUMO-protein ligase RNF212 [Centruroides vittatus]|uniref:probable E3 SUMO-protein ligase RNF212 n=1 Tax=Centruroides vittatus TaxID=120091 RepID=UPI00350F75E8